MTSSENRRPKQRLYLINRDFQLRYAWAVIWIGLLSTLVTSTVILVPLYQFQILRIPKFLPTPILFAMVLAVVLNIALLGFMSVHVTHKLAGPMFSFLRYIRRVEQGIWAGKLQLREGDELQFLARNFNEMLASLQKLAEADLVSLDEIKAKLPSSEDNKQATALIEALQLRLQNRLTEQASEDE